jgi:hypothetical protein
MNSTWGEDADWPETWPEALRTALVAAVDRSVWLIKATISQNGVAASLLESPLR